MWLVDKPSKPATALQEQSKVKSRWRDVQSAPYLLNALEMILQA